MGRSPLCRAEQSTLWTEHVNRRLGTQCKNCFPVSSLFSTRGRFNQIPILIAFSISGSRAVNHGPASIVYKVGLACNYSEKSARTHTADTSLTNYLTDNTSFRVRFDRFTVPHVEKRAATSDSTHVSFLFSFQRFNTVCSLHSTRTASP